MASDWDKADAYVNGPADYEEIPELTDADFVRGTLMMNGKPLKPGQDQGLPDGTQQQVILHLDT